MAAADAAIADKPSPQRAAAGTSGPGHHDR
jgi:hypothetical protein